MSTFTPGARLGRYEIRSKLGHGGMADVYLADDTQLGRPVALKVLRPEDQADVVARKRLEREARAAATLDHPHICAIYEVGDVDGVVYIAMQYVDGVTLAARMARGQLEFPELLRIATEIADAVADAHAHGVLHRDLKPANVMLTAREQVKVLDFGLAKVGASAGTTETVSVLSGPGVVLGTVPYMSPEQVRGAELDPRSDLFSLGVVLYEMVCGRRPFDDSSSAATASAILTREPQSIARFAPNTPPELERIIMKALRKQPDERYQTAKDLLVDLRSLRDEHAFQARLERGNPPSDRPATAPGTPASGPAAVASGGGGMSMRWLAAAAVIIVVAAGGWWWRERANAQWAATELKEVSALADARRNYEAFDRAVVLEPYVPGNATLAALMRAIGDTITVKSEPAGARVFLTRFQPGADGTLPARQLAGTTPIENLRIARGQYVMALDLDGYASEERTISGVTVRQSALTITPPPIEATIRLTKASALPARMVFVPGSNYRLAAWGRPTDRRVPLDDFFIDKYEVSNRDFKEFITAGGYVRREFWPASFIKDGKTLAWNEAMALMVDRTGLPGPRQWSNQSVPEGRADHPVTDVTWYEAAAYGVFRRKELPTVFQWEKAARDGVVPYAGTIFMPWGTFYPGDTLDRRANFGAATWPVTSGEFGMSRFGAYNMAGNVSEWTRNDSSDGYLATGGAFGDPTYTFAQFGGRPPFFVSNKLGFRLVKPAGPAKGDQGAGRIEIAKDVPSWPPTPDAVFNKLAETYRYDASAPLDPRVEETIDTTDWKREKISFNGAGGERAFAFLYLPHHAQGPVQVFHFVPAGDVEGGFRPPTASAEDRLSPYIKAGRGAFVVVLKGYIGRPRPDGFQFPDARTVEFVENTVQRVTDLRRGVDYLVTRPDIDKSAICFFGPSAGAQLGLIEAAVEPRYRGVLMIGSGLPSGYSVVIKEANPVHFAGHIRQPKFLLQGHYDEDSPLSTASDPLFKLMIEPKQRTVFEGTHVPTNDVLIAATSSWLDKTLGPVIR